MIQKIACGSEARFGLTLGAMLLAAFCISCSNKNETAVVQYLQHPDWEAGVKAGLNDFMEDCADLENAYAVFDFDNTCSIFDVEEQLAVYQLETMSFAMTPERLSEVLASGLAGHGTEYLDWIHDIDSAYACLYGAYGPFSAGGLSDSAQAAVQADPCWQEFSAKMLAMYDKVGEWASVDDSYNWILYWFSGMTPDEVYNIAYNSHKKYAAVETSVETWKSPSDFGSRLGQTSVSWTRGVQVSENIRELWKCLSENGIDVWVCSASGIDQIMAAVDAFGLREYCTGVLAMTVRTDSAGMITNAYDYDAGCAAVPTPEGWARGSLPTKAQTAGPGKVTAIMNSISPLYGGATPVAGFMDSTGDFNFCTEFASLKLVVCFNRANRKITDGGGLIAEVAMYEKETLGYDYKKARDAGNTLYLLQGRQENGLRSLRPSNMTIRYGAAEERLFANQDNWDQLQDMIDRQLTVGQAINEFSANFLDSYPGYHSR